MKKLIITFILVAIFLLTAVPANAQIAVTPLDSGNEGDLVTEILGSGITVVPGTVVYKGATGSNASAGFFDSGLDAGIGIDKGILLTSGYASNVTSSNTQDGITGIVGLGGDTDLDGLISGYTNDATVLEFDFTSAGGDLYFNYVFGSDEYNEYVGSFNDVFGFFLDGANIALIPGTTTPVSIDNVNNGINSAYYNDNDPSDTSVPYAFEYDGFTDVFTASALGLSAGTHHIKLAIADALDTALDSGVFIQGSSFSDEPEPIVPVPGAFLLGMLGLSVAGVKLRKHA